MSNKQRAADGQKKPANRPVRKPDLTAEQLEELDGLANPAKSVVGSAAANAVQAQAAALKDGRLPVARRRAMAVQIGRVAGNHYLQRVILEGEGPPQNHHPTDAAGRQIQYRTPFSAVVTRSSPDQDGPSSEPAEEEELVVPGEITTPLEMIESGRDSISATISHVPSVTPGGATPSGFGITRASALIDTVKIKSVGGKFVVTGNFVHTITWKVRSGTGPRNQKDIGSENDAKITAANYKTVASDLTPDMSSDNGRPPRTKFWAEDLTIRHELFHTKQRSGYIGDNSAKAIKKYLDSKKAASAAQIKNSLLQPALNAGIRVYNAYVKQPRTEGDAYGDGAPLYKARSKAIKKKGKAGKYK